MEPHVLIVDGDPQVRAQLSTLLTMRGCRVHTASDGQEALTALEAFRPSLVLLEMRLPGLNGWELARELTVRDLDVSIVVMGPEDEARRWAEETGATGFLPKPVEVARLLACVRIPDDENAASAA